ncbi:MAG: polysaccharide pyruvyl transferase family protein, partial [Miltoncostaeaceae bacterium]
MRILIDNGEYGVVNRGDMAMMSVALKRLIDRWPDAELGILTSAPTRLRLFFPQALPIVPARGGAWPAGPALERVPQRGVRLALRAERIGESGRSLARRAQRRMGRLHVGDGGDLAGRASWPPAAVWSADLLVGAGGGYLTDVDPEQVRRTLTLFDAAHEAGIPTALMGQGVGPLERADLVGAASTTLGRIGLIATREALAGPGRLAALGVPQDRVVVTGDDAVEFAHGLRRPGLGSHIGVNLRVVDYTGIDDGGAAWVREAVHAAAFTLQASLAPIPVSEWEDEDRRGTRAVVDGFPAVIADRGRNATPEHAARRVGSCRVMVTGTYHAAVFALSQGVPVVAISRSRYYDDKFHGLADQFP